MINCYWSHIELSAPLNSLMFNNPSSEGRVHAQPPGGLRDPRGLPVGERVVVLVQVDPRRGSQPPNAQLPGEPEGRGRELPGAGPVQGAAGLQRVVTGLPPCRLVLILVFMQAWGGAAGGAGDGGDGGGAFIRAGERAVGVIPSGSKARVQFWSIEWSGDLDWIHLLWVPTGSLRGSRIWVSSGPACAEGVFFCGGGAVRRRWSGAARWICCWIHILLRADGYRGRRGTSGGERQHGDRQTQRSTFSNDTDRTGPTGTRSSVRGVPLHLKPDGFVCDI